MATSANDSTKANETWPLPKFNFEVDFGDTLKGVAFMEVSGLDAETQVIEYRHSNEKQFSAIKMPGIVKYANITLKKGIFTKDDNFFSWYQSIQLNTIKRMMITIRLIDQTGATTMQWQLNNAWVTKITGTDLKADGNEVVLESMEIAHEGLIITNGK